MEALVQGLQKPVLRRVSGPQAQRFSGILVGSNFVLRIWAPNAILDLVLLPSRQ
jgi:hypothetical protein